ncbi:MAG: MmcB family DNA repair protein [Acidimicrobiales bacterium]
MTATSTPLSAGDIRDALHLRWPDGDYVVIEEAPDGVLRQGRRLDLVAMSTWRSRGYEIDGVEVKVSVSDYRREIKDAEKADWWWRHVHRFWIAVPAEIAPRVQEGLPPTWGLLAVSGGVARTVVKAPRHEAQPLGWNQCLGLLRAASHAGVAALQRAEATGYRRGAESTSETKAAVDMRTQRDLADLQKKVAVFKSASGIDVGDTWGDKDAERLGHLVASVQHHLGDPENAADAMRRMAGNMTRHAEALAVLATEFGESLGASSLTETASLPLNGRSARV